MKHAKEYTKQELDSSGIYKITNIVNNKIYVGSTIREIRKRWTRWKSNLNKGKGNIHLASAWNKYGEENFIFEILEIIEDKNNIIPREQFYIDTLKPDYNIFLRAGHNPTGSKLSEEEMKKKKEALSKELLLIDPEGKEVLIKGIRQFCIEFNLDRRSIQRICAGSVFSHKGWRKYDPKLVNQKSRYLELKDKKIVLTPQKFLVSIINIKQFCASNNLDFFAFKKFYYGERKSYKGWTLV